MDQKDIDELKKDFESGKISQSDMTKEQVHELYKEYMTELERLNEENADLKNIISQKKKEIKKLIKKEKNN